MSKVDTGGPAFPVPLTELRWVDSEMHGQTLRDCFAAKAMQGLLASSNCPVDVCENQLAIYSYQVADAMLKARNGNS